MLVHFFSGSYTTLNYLVDVVILIGAIYSGYKGTLKYQKDKKKKQDNKLDDSISDAVRGAVDVAVARLMVRVDDQVEKSVQEELENVNKKLDRVESQFDNNGGSSMKDSQDRLEASISKLIDGQTVILEGQAATQEILKAQDEKVAVISERLESNVTSVVELGQIMQRHLGAHEGLPGPKGERGDTGPRGDAGERGLTGDKV